MKILTAQQMREADRLTTERYNIPSLQLMENAGAAIADYLQTAYPNLAARRILVLCGKGNNGGDGLVVARLLRERGAKPQVLLFADPSTVRGDAATNLKLWQQGTSELQGVTNQPQWDAARSALSQSDLVVDALLGTGLTGPVEGLLAAVISDLNAAHAKAHCEVVAVDMPSGLASDAKDYGGPIVDADVTVTLTAPKVGQMLNPSADHVGKLIVRQIGTPPALLDDDPTLKLHWLEPSEFRALPMVRNRDSNKGSFGHALIIAGSLGKSGAAAMAGRAALRVGAGLVTVATPSVVLPIVAAGMPELMTVPLLANAEGSACMENLTHGPLTILFHGKSVLAIGPGLSSHKDTQQFIRTVLTETSLPVILDADGLNAYAGRTEELTSRGSSILIMTPHPGEMARLLGVSVPEVQARRLEVALEASQRWQAFIVLKGSHTILATPDGRAYINTTGNPGMATGGTGDVLTGILAGLSAEFSTMLSAEVPESITERWARVIGLGVYLHGLAGDLAAARVGEAPLIATDLIEALPEVFAHFLAEWKHVQ
jgi:ADP-dependent NAD(P)H-hydrate dehydratase / NAD(P)H-hydrate epimerase